MAAGPASKCVADPDKGTGLRRPKTASARLWRPTSVQPARTARRRFLVRYCKVAERISRMRTPVMLRPETDIAVLVVTLVAVPY